MNWNQIQGQWKQLKGRVKEEWGDLTDDELEEIAGKRDVFVGKLQSKYGITREKAEEKADN